MSETLDKMTVPRLRDMAKELGVVGTSGMKKEQLIHEIVALKPELAPPEKEHAKVVIGRQSRDIPTLKAQRSELKKRIAEAVKAKDRTLVRKLRKNKKHARRLLKKARAAGLLAAPAPVSKEEKKG